MDVEIVTATVGDVLAVTAEARADDRIEVYAATGREITDAALLTLDMSSMAWVGLVDGTPVCAFGVVPDGIFGESGQPWLVATDELERYQVSFLRRCCYYVNTMRDAFPYLHNWVDERNDVSKRWLHWMGFEIGDAVPFGPFGATFHHFDMGVKQ